VRAQFEPPHSGLIRELDYGRRHKRWTATGEMS
jgi:hypothetical protein